MALKPKFLGVVLGWHFLIAAFDISTRMDIGWMSVYLRDVSNHTVHISFPGIHSHDGQDGIDPVVLLAVDRFYIETVDFENAEDVSVLNEPLGNAVAVVPHVIGLLVEGEPVEGTEVHVA